MTASQHRDPLRLMRLLQLASPALPVGAYSYSQGLESAVHAGTVYDEPSATAWIDDALALVMMRFEGPILLAMLAAAARRQPDELHALNALFLASRESAELRAETLQMGSSLRRLLGELPETHAAAQMLERMQEPTYPCAWASAAVAFGLDHAQAHCAYLWSWLENQVMAAIKVVPLGQSAGQRMLARLAAHIARTPSGAARDEDVLANFAPGLAIASSMHETQYTRLFRS